MFDYHMHSDFSADCDTPMEKTIEFAIKKGLKEICFTEHSDYDYPDPTIEFDLDLEKYAEEIKRAQAKYNGKIVIKNGIEVGIQPHVLDYYNHLLNKNTFDFVICSMHAADKKNLHRGDFFNNRTAVEAYELYYEELLYCVQHFDQFSVLGHLDLVKRYKEINNDANFHDLIQEIFTTIIPK